MGANGSIVNGILKSDAGRKWCTIATIGDIQVIQKKNRNDSNKLPEESHTPNRIYAIFEKDGRDVKAIAKYGKDGKKEWEIHTTDHDNLGPHYHLWTNGRPIQTISENGRIRNEAYSLTPYMQSILNKVRNYE